MSVLRVITKLFQLTYGGNDCKCSIRDPNKPKRFHRHHLGCIVGGRYNVECDISNILQTGGIITVLKSRSESDGGSVRQASFGYCCHDRTKKMAW